MTEIPCPICLGPTPDGLLCRVETARLVADLKSLPGLMAEMRTDLTRQSRKGSGGRGSGTPLVFGFDAAWTRDAVVGTIASWIRELAELHNEDLYTEVKVPCVCRPPWKLTSKSCPGAHTRIEFIPGDTMDSWCSWLIHRINRIRGHQAVEQIVDELTDAVRSVRQAIDRPADREYVCLCPICGKGVYGPAGAHDDTEVTCRECRRIAPRDDNGRLLADLGAFHVGDERIRRHQALRDSVLPERDVLTAVAALRGEPLSPKTFRNWVNRYEAGVAKAHIAPIACHLIWKDDEVVDWKPAYWVDEAMRLAANIPAKRVAPQPEPTKKGRIAS